MNFNGEAAGSLSLLPHHQHSFKTKRGLREAMPDLPVFCRRQPLAWSTIAQSTQSSRERGAAVPLSTQRASPPRRWDGVVAPSRGRVVTLLGTRSALGGPF